MQRFLTGLLITLLIISLIANFLIWNRYSSSRPLVVVGGESISKKMYQDLLDYQAGNAALKKLVYSSLVNQAATKAGVMPTMQDVDQRIAEIRRRSPQALSDADRDPAKLQELKRNLLSDIALENLRIKDINVSDSEISAFYAANKRSFALPQQVQTTMVVTETATDAQTAVSLLQAGMKDDVIARQPRMHVAGIGGFNVDMDKLGETDKKNISAVIFAMNPGDIRVVPVKGAYLVFRVKKSELTYVPALSQIRPLVIRALKLQKSPSAQYVLASLYQTVKPEFQVTQYESFFDDIKKYDLKAATAAEKAAGHIK